MNRVNLQTLLLFSLALFVFACGEDEIPDPGPQTCVQQTYDAGLYISNEGPFSDGSGSITYYNPNTKAVSLNSFSFNNCDEVLGSIVQSISVFENKAYIMVNNSNKMIVADAATLEEMAVVEGLELPRYFLSVGDDKAFISQWGSDGLSGSIAVVDLNSLQILKTIPCGTGPGNMLRINNQVYVANNGGFGRDSTIAIIDIATETLTKSIVAGDNPHSFAVDNIGNLWCLASGYTDWMEPTNSTMGQLSLISSDNVQQTIEVPNSSKWLAINNSGTTLFYLSPGGVFQQSVSTTTAATSPFITGNFYALAVDFNTDQIYASDALDFASAGTVSRYESDGTLVETFGSGVVPGGFWFD